MIFFFQSNIPAILGTETVVNKKPEADTIPVNATILSGSTILVFVVALVLVYAGAIESTAKVRTYMEEIFNYGLNDARIGSMDK